MMLGNKIFWIAITNIDEKTKRMYIYIRTIIEIEET